MSPQQIRDAVELIAVSGVPGDTDSYQHGDLFDINWDAFEEHDEIVLTNLVAIDDSPRFSAREATALIAGLQYLSSLPENAGSATLASLTAKLSRGASAAPAQVGVEESETDAGLGTTLALIRDSVSRGVQLELDYLDSAGKHERRRVDPLRVESFDDDWYLRGWCHLREAVRTFRLDRISNAVITDAPIEHRADEVRLPDRLFEASPERPRGDDRGRAGGHAAAGRLHPRRRDVDRGRRSHPHHPAGLALPRPEAAHRQHAGRGDGRRAAERPRRRRRVGSGRCRPVPLSFIA